ncbi:ABC transporter substrate-binding protein [Acidisoma silvae]|uniref:ABC transporter substrate-binding protein n=1 Tax=Acidisoma silvae TaxID=2802396 RepID=A0A963YVR9_9PROT|nr:ABC transporter substrate-binding protein [Acidisoma silvae]MCB8878014.1 ABC transporter substrate-binding protein [Acidisoma silvae]
MTTKRVRWRKKILFLAAGLGIFSFQKQSPAQAAPLQTIHMLDQPLLWACMESIVVADKKGFFKEHGLNLEYVPLPPEQYTVSLDSGVTDFAPCADYAYFINVRDKGLKVKEIVSSHPLIDPVGPGDGLFVRADSPIKSPKDLKGKTIGMLNLSFSSAWFTLDYLGRAGLTRDDINYIAIPYAQEEQVLKAGQIDALYAFQPLAAQLLKRGGYRELFQLSDLPGRVITRGGTMAKIDFINKHPDIIRDYVAAIAEADDWGSQHPDEVVKIGIAAGRLPADLAPWTYNKQGKADYSSLHWSPHGLQNDADVQFWIDLDVREGIVPKGKWQPSDIYTNDFNPYSQKQASSQ